MISCLIITYLGPYHLLHSSEIRGLCSTKSSRKMLQNLPYFWNTKIHVVFFVFHFVLLYFFPNECPGLCRQYGKFWSVLRELFVEHKPLISEECPTVHYRPVGKYSAFQNLHQWFWTYFRTTKKIRYKIWHAFSYFRCIIISVQKFQEPSLSY